MSKLCPICNKEWPDEFMACPLDGATLIEKPQQPAGFNLNLGDANAISGGVNMSDNHSVNNNTVNTSTNNVDSHNVITNNITQIERDKTPEELIHEKEYVFREECLKVYSNGIMTSEQKRNLEDLQYRLGLDESSASKILSEVAKRSERKASTLSPVHRITFNNIKTALNANRLDLINRLMAQLKAMVQRYSVEEIQFTYYMLQAVLHPEECIQEYETHHEDKYWQSFWSSIAYRKIGNVEQSELLVADVENKWTDTKPQENVFILATVNALIDKDFDTAKSLYDNIVGEHSPYLSNLATCLYTLLYDDVMSSDEIKQMQKDGAFYTKNLFNDIKKRTAERKIEDDNLRTKKLHNVKKEKAEPQESSVTESTDIVDKSNEENEAIVEDITKTVSAPFDPKIVIPFTNDFGYLRKLDPSKISKLKAVLLSAPQENYKALFLLGQLYLQESSSAINQKLAYDAIKAASEHGVYEAGAYMAYFYLYGKIVPQNFDEAEQRIRIDDDYKKNPVFIQMLIDLYCEKGNTMLADVWRLKLNKFKDNI
ncbi:MAG: hypothetical protein SPG68_08090 [Prevotella sp.]|nr:hypothetical protein [Prevotella sp.]